MSSVNQGKILSFVTACFLALCSGSLYGFSAYSAGFGKILGELNGQSEPMNVDIVGSIGDLGLYLGITVGLFYDKFGSKATAILAAIATTVSFSLVALTLCGYLLPQIWIVCIYFFLIGQASHCMYINAYSTTLKSYGKQHKGKLTGLFLALYGLSSVIYTLIFRHALNSNVIHLFVLFTVVSATASCLAIFFVRPYVPEAPKLNLQDSINLEENPFEEVQLINNPSPLEEVTGVQLLQRSSFWLVFIVHLFSAGSGLLWKNIVGSVCASFGLDPGSASSMVITWSLVNTAARILMGLVADYFVSSVPRPAWGVPCLIMAIAAFSSYFFISPSNVFFILWVITIFSGAGYGGPFSMNASLFAIYFGTQNIGFNAGVLSFAPAIGGTSFLAISHTFLNESNTQCMGSDCYQPVLYLLLPCLSIAAILLSLLTYYHFKHYHEKKL